MIIIIIDLKSFNRINVYFNDLILNMNIFIKCDWEKVYKICGIGFNKKFFIVFCKLYSHFAINIFCYLTENLIYNKVLVFYIIISKPNINYEYEIV